MRDIYNQRFGQLTAMHVAGRDSTGKVTWLCVCECGRQKAVTMLNLTSGNTKSCGCARTLSRKRAGHREVHRLISTGLSGGDALFELLNAGKAQHYAQKLAEVLGNG